MHQQGLSSGAPVPQSLCSKVLLTTVTLLPPPHKMQGNSPLLYVMVLKDPPQHGVPIKKRRALEHAKAGVRKVLAPSPPRCIKH